MDGGEAVPGGKHMLMEKSGPQLLNDVNAHHAEWQGWVRQAEQKDPILLIDLISPPPELLMIYNKELPLISSNASPRNDAQE